MLVKVLPAIDLLVPSGLRVDQLLTLGGTAIRAARRLRMWSRALRHAAAAQPRPLVPPCIRGGSGNDPHPYGDGVRLDGIPVLVVEDDDDSREMLTSLLRSLGALVVAVSTARRALLVLSEVTPAAIVTDLSMPGEDGVWLLRRLRESARWRHLPVIGFTGRYDIRAARAAGFDALLRKPDDLERMCATIARLTERRVA